MEGYDLPEIEIVAKDKSKPQTYTHTPTAAEVYDGKLTADAQTYVPTSEESTVVETKTREPRVRHQRDVNFGEGLAKIASVMGIGQGDGGRDRVAAREQRAIERRERQDARQDARQARQEVRDARQDARQAVRYERQALRDARVAENRENRLNAQQVRREARQERMEGKPQGLSRLDAPTTDAPAEVTAPADKAPAKTYGVTEIEEPNVTRRPSGEGGTNTEQREITDAEAREMRGYVDGEPAAANGQGAERKVTYIEEPNVQRRPVSNEDETVAEDKPISDEEARKMRGYGDGAAPESEGGYEDPYKDAYEYKQKLSNEIDYSDNAKRAEMERAHQEWLESDPYRNSDEFKVQLTDDITAKPAGSTAGTETTEEGDGVTTTEGGTEGGTTGSEGNGTTTEGGGEPQGGNGATTTEGNGTEGGDQGGDDDSKLSDAEWINKYMKDLGFDKEEVERQKKAAKWAVAAQMLADSIGALSNVYWTGKGANAMKFEPGAPKAAAAANKMYADIAAAREKALKAALDEREKQFERAYRADRDRKQDEKDARAQENWQKTFDANEKWREQQQQNWVTGNAQSQTQQAIANALSERGMKVQEQQAKTAAAREYRLGKDENKPEMFLLDEGWVSVPKEKWTDTEVAAVYSKIPKEIRESIEKVVTDEGYGRTTSKSIKPTPQQMRQWIGEYKHLSEVANAIRRLAGVKTMAPNEEEVKSEVVVDPLTGKSYSVNPENPVIGGTQKKKPNPMNS